MRQYIYGLFDPTTQKISYVGRTNNPQLRWEQHAETIEKSTKAGWITKLRSAGITPIMIILDEFEGGDEKAIEQWWIEFGRRVGWPLTNTISVNSDRYNIASIPLSGGVQGMWNKEGKWIALADFNAWMNQPVNILGVDGEWEMEEEQYGDS